MIQEEPCRRTINDELTLFSITLDAATHQAFVIFSFEQELPEAKSNVLSKINIMLDHLVREEAIVLIAKE